MASSNVMMNLPPRFLLIAAACLSVTAAPVVLVVPPLGAALAVVSAALIGLAVLRSPADTPQVPAVASLLLGHVEAALDALSDAQSVEGDPGRLRLLYAADAAVARAAGAAEDALAIAGQPALGNDPAPMAIMDVIRVGLSGVDDLAAVRIDASPLISVDGCRARPLARLIGRLAERHGTAPMTITAASTPDGAVMAVVTPVPVESAESALAAAACVTAHTNGDTVQIDIGPDLLAVAGLHDHDLDLAQGDAPVPPSAAERPREPIPAPSSPEEQSQTRKRGLLSLFGRGDREDIGWSTSLRPPAEPSQSQLSGFVDDFVPVEPEPEPTAKTGGRLPPPEPAFTRVNQQVKRGEVAEDYVPPTVDGPLMDLIADLPSAVPDLSAATDGPDSAALPVRQGRASAPTLMAGFAAELEGLL
ncbi:hypothetical protein DVS28_b0361 (plasmid) [Euzebya pacifica]|uniref:Uncharacterized protein n=1 Tax=Euzebya pacifica TaxID=1608957 RepID=A0A346Y6N4_9ACTN|nr:hypothetical protein [Euzebya pacifica]AXV10131.1 hypothetical protein DVS28_b0361 [Euzebya pacifica]